jgi:hypothetical protein
MKNCHICYSNEEELFICDKCEELYCLDCSYTFSIHFQYEGSLCYWCSEQKRLKTLSKSDIRENKLKLIL